VIGEDRVLTGFFPEDKGPYALTPNTVELIPTLGALFPRGGPGPRMILLLAGLQLGVPADTRGLDRPEGPPHRDQSSSAQDL